MWPRGSSTARTEPGESIDGVVFFPVPGQTRGSVLFHVDGHLRFSGDSLAWNPDRGTLTAFLRACWYSWPSQIDSLRRFSNSGLGFDRHFTGHGWSHDADAATFAAELPPLLAWMEAVA